MRTALFIALAALLCGCSGVDKKKPPIGVSAMRFTIGGNPALEVRVTDKWIMVGRRGVVKAGKGVSGVVDKRHEPEEIKRKKLKVKKLARWKLTRKGDQLVGTVAGKPAVINVTRKGKDLKLEGKVGASEIKVQQRHYSLHISAEDTSLDFGMELSGSTGGGRVWMSSDGCCRLSVSEAVLRRTGTPLELAMLVLAMEFAVQNQVVDEKIHPGWDDELSDKENKLIK